MKPESSVVVGENLALSTVEKTKAYEKRLLHVVFDGFDNATLEQVSQITAECGLPLSQIRKIKLHKGFIRQGEERAPTIARYDARTGILTISTEAFVPRERLMRALVHEIAHSCTPLKIPRDDVSVIAFPGEEKTAEFIRSVISQTLETRIFINDEHAYVHKQYVAGELSFYDFAEETWAILVDQRYTNPSHLRQIDEAQRKSMDQRGKKSLAVSLLSSEGSKKAIGIDTIVMEKIGLRSKNPASLDQHISNFRSTQSAD